MNKRYWDGFKYVLLWLITPLLTSLLLVLGTPLLRVLERVYGQSRYWLTGTILLFICAVSGLMDLFCIFTSMWICQGVYGFFEARGRGNVGTALIAVLAGVGGFFFSLGSLLGPENIKKFSNDTEAALTQVMGDMHLSGEFHFFGFELAPSQVLQLLPYMISLVVLVGFACSLMLDRRIAMLVNLPFNQVVTHLSLSQFRLPAICLWIFLISALGALLGPPGAVFRIICLNLSCFLFSAYFFQGLAVFEAGLTFFRIGPLLRILLYILVVGNLFFLLSLIGIADFWLDFRTRMKREIK